jgi:hypothetical protein
MSYHDRLSIGLGLKGGLSVHADRTVYCESGVTIASLFDVFNM